MSKFSRTIRIMAVGTLLLGTVAIAPGPATGQPATGRPAALAPAGDGLDRAALRRSLDAVPAAGVPGALAAVRAGRADWRGAAGIADLATARRARPEMRHRVASVTKTFVATTLLQLVEEGRLNLDDPVGRWLPELVPGEVGQRVTVRMLLNHTSGIGNYTDALLNSLAAIEQVGQTTYTPAELVTTGLALPRTGEPGATYSYSNTNYILAGLLIEQVTGNDPADEIARRILRPLRLTDTYFPGVDPKIRGPHGGAYFAPLGVRNFSEYGMTWAWMAGELIATMDDLNTFFRALLSGRLLSERALGEMLRTVPFDPNRPEFGGYGLGIYQVPTPCGPLWGHDGAAIGQLTISLHSRDAARQVSIGINISHYQLWPSDEPHPIDIAWQGFAVTAPCPPGAATSARTLPTLRLPAITAAAEALR